MLRLLSRVVPASGAVLVVLVLLLSSDERRGCDALRLEGFGISPFWNEQIKNLSFAPKVQIEINAPADEFLDPALPTLLVLYALPNGNTIAETIGKKVGPNTDWHFGIQEIGAQTRRLRQLIGNGHQNIIVAYLANSLLSWPAWRGQNQPNSGALIDKIIQTVQMQLSQLASDMKIVLASHSGGGSFDFGFIGSVSAIPDNIQRICLLDSDYDYNDALYGAKLIQWLNTTELDHFLVVVCYDDRYIKYHGKNVTCPTCGTYRHTYQMIHYMQQHANTTQFNLTGPTVTDDGELNWFTGLSQRVTFAINTNPKNLILHTELVRRNGFEECITAGTPFAASNPDKFWIGPINYDPWIQPY